MLPTRKQVDSGMDGIAQKLTVSLSDSQQDHETGLVFCLTYIL